MRPALLLLFTLLTLSAWSQRSVKGMVKDAATNLPIAGASVFLNNTSVGTATNSNGEFELFLPSGKYELIVSSISYATANQTVSSFEAPSYLTIKLNPKAQELETVVVEAFDKDGWEKWGQFFTDQFIGTSAIAADCKLKNKEVLRFRHSKKNNELTVLALEPLIIENPALGYTLRFQLETFSFNFYTKYLFYQGYPLFILMQGNEARQRRWGANREEAYYGSMLHFMRSLYRNTLAAEGFELRRLKKLPNLEKERVRGLAKGNYWSERSTGGGRIVQIGKPFNDSSEYYERILRQPDQIDILNPNLLTGDSIAYAVDSLTAGVAFDDYLQILYTKKTVPTEFKRLYPKQSTAMLSQITLLNNKPIEVQSNGIYFDPMDLMHMGYWSWSEKVGTLLPLDYKPTLKTKER